METFAISETNRGGYCVLKFGNLELLNSISEDQPRLKQAVHLNSLDGDHLFLVNSDESVPTKLLLLCLCHVHTLWAFCRCLWNKGRKPGKEGRRKGGWKEGKTSWQGGRKGKRKGVHVRKRVHTELEHCSWIFWQQITLKHQGHDCREDRQQKGKLFFPFNVTPMSNNTVLSEFHIEVGTRY